LTPKADLSCFQDSYQTARKRLLQTLAQITEGLTQEHHEFRHPLTGPDKNPVYLDWFQFGQTDTPEHLLVLMCGTHGVEGFTGSAIQCHWMPALAEQMRQDAKLGVLLVHALNPWGFAWLRRYDHEGVDLNRNFIDFSAPLPENPEYDLLHNDLFHDTTEPLDAVLSGWRKKLGQQGFDSAITRGQYRHADGLFYGGYSASWSRQVLEQAGEKAFLRHASQIAVIDLHTGLGPFGHGEVINDHIPDSTGFKLACDWYGANAQSALLGESCSPPKTGLLDYFWHKLVGERGCFVTLEFGTYALEKLVYLSCMEQRYYIRNSQGDKPRDLDHSSVIALRDFFYPRDEIWRELVLFRSGQIITLALQGLRT
jgi:predicted deacylase